MSSGLGYFGKFDDDNSPARLQEIIDLQWGILGRSIHLIASASYPFPSVLRAMGEPSFVLPLEGVLGARFLPGSQAMDLVEAEGEALTLRLLGEPPGYGVALQPHSGTQANQIVYNAVLRPDDTVLCLQADQNWLRGSQHLILAIFGAGHSEARCLAVV